MGTRFNRTTRLRTARFTTPGTSVTGTVLSVVDAPTPDFVDGRIVGPKFDVNGTLVMQPDITVQTEDGGETIIHGGVGIEVAIAQALAKIGEGTDLEPGDVLTVTYVTDEDADEGIPTKVYEAVVVKPKPGKSKG